MKQITLLFFLIAFQVGLNAQTWTQVGNDIDGETSGDAFSGTISLSLDGNILAVGALGFDGVGTNLGQVKVYENTLGTWEQIGQSINGNNNFDGFGSSISLSSSGNILAIGAIEAGSISSGQVKVYENISGAWLQLGQDIEGEGSRDEFGTSVSLSSNGKFLAVGAPRNDSNGRDSGHVRVYENILGTWTQIGEDIDGKSIRDSFGSTVSLNYDGNVLAIGAPLNDDRGSDSGHVRVYKNMNGTWTKIGNDLRGNTSSNRFGSSLALNSNGTILGVGATGADSNGRPVSYVKVYENISETWNQIGTDITGERETGFFGESISVNSTGNILAIGDSRNRNNGAFSGQVKAFENIQGVWTQVAQSIEGTTTEDFLGTAIALSSNGKTLAIGAPQNGFSPKEGIAKVFELDESSLSIAEFSKNLNQSNFYPNPATSKITFNDNLEFDNVAIFNIEGKKMLSHKNPKQEINISTLQVGVYLIKFFKNKTVVTARLIKK